MQVGILGPLEVRVGGRDVTVGGARLRTLLIRLAIDPGRTVPASALVEALWPDEPETGPRQIHALHSLVSRLRRALPGDELRSVAGGYRLELPPDAVDAVRFERLARAGRAALQESDPGTARRVLSEALALWRGGALADVVDEPFAAGDLARLDELRLAATEDKAQADLLCGAEPAVLVAELTALTTAHPRRERAQALLLRALHADGRSAEALERYAEIRSALADGLGADPSPQLRAAHLAVLRAEEPGGARLRRGNLRTPLTTFVGRQEERALVARRLGASRLVTLTGPGGAGKTRLATTVARDVAAGLRGGAWFVELAAVTDPAAVAQAAVDAFGSQGTGSAAGRPIDRLVDAVSPESTLLVLDNCEHLLDAVAAVCEELLGRCPALAVLATSREPLGITGEALVPVPPLPLAARTADVEEIRDSPAVRLFAERATAADPGFALTPQNAAVVADICRNLDGLPLTIELAAARARSVPVEHLASMLDDRFTLLTSGSRTALPRHRTLAAVIGWSWDLLTDDERRLVEALSVFPGTITPDAAERVCPPDIPAAPAALQGLVDKSLLQRVDGPGARYRMLETIREYALRRLTASGDAERARAVHTRHFLELAEAAAPDLRGPGQLTWIPRLTAERDNLLGALQLACSTGDDDIAVRLATALSFFLTLHGDHAQAARLLRTALAMPSTTPVAVHAPAVAAYLVNAVLSGAVDEDTAGLDRFRAAARSGHPSALVIAPLLATLSGDPAGGLLDTDPPSHAAPFGKGMFWLMRALLRAGDLSRTCTDLAAAAAVFRTLGERWGTAVSLTYLGAARLLIGDRDEALTALRDAQAAAAELGNDDHERVWLATAYMYTGATGRARAELHAVISGHPAAHHLALARMRLGDMARRDGDLAAAAHEYDRAQRALGGAASDRRFRATYRSGRAQLALAAGDTAGAGVDLQVALNAAVAAADATVTGTVACAIAALRACQGAPESAAAVLGAGHVVRGAADAHHPDVARLTHELRRALGDRFPGCYEQGRTLARADVTALLKSELAAAAVVRPVIRP